MALNEQFMLAPSPQWVFVDPSTGEPLANGFVYLYKDNARSTLKPAYTLVGGVGSYDYIPLPNPIPLSGGGTPTDGVGNDIYPYMYPYDADGNIELYYLVIKDADGNTKETRQAWPNLVDSTPTTNNFTYNYMRNWQFFSWSNGTDYTNVKTGSVDQYDFMIDDWIYQQDDSGQTIEISQGIYTLGDNSVPTNSPYYLIYKNTGGSTLGTFNCFEQYFQSVETLEGKNVVVELWARKGASGAVGPISISATQDFGSGGSPSAQVETTLLTIPSLTASWQRFVGNALIPSTTTKTRGTNGDDALIIQINMPLNVTAEIHIGSIRLEEGIEIAGAQIISNDAMQQETNTFALYPPFSTGDVKFTLKTASDPGWLLMDDTTIGKPGSGSTHMGFSYYALFSLIWNNVHSTTWAPIYDNAGNVSSYTTLDADWNGLKRLSLTRTLGRALAGIGVSNVFFPVTFPLGSNQVLFPTGGANSFYTGQPISFSLGAGGSLPPEISILTQYFVCRNLGGSNITIATTYQRAIDGQNIVLSATGTPTVFITATFANHAMGEIGGQLTHSLIVDELPDHDHPGINGAFVMSNTTGGGVYVPNGATGQGNLQANTGKTGQSVAFNTLQPTSFMNIMIKL